jgi:predicted peptidase
LKKFVLHIIAFFCCTQLLFGHTNVDTVVSLIEAHTYKTMPYRLLKPVNLNSNNKFPVIISLHGAGGRGIDNKKKIKDSKWIHYMAQENIRQDYPSYLLVPKSNELWNKDHLNKFKEIISQLSSVDTNRIYILGHSMGGHGTYRLIQIDPDYFAASAPSAGSGLPGTEDFNDVSVIKNIPI